MTLVADSDYPRVISALHGLETRQIRVGKTVTAAFHQITDAILASRPYDRIVVESGTYFENITIKHPLELCGAKDAEPPTIVSVGPCLVVDVDGPIILHGLNITAKGNRASENQAVVVKRGNPRIEECDMTSLYVKNDSKPHVSHCRIHSSRHGVGISVIGNGSGIYEHNHIFGHEGESLYFDTAGKPIVRHNRISETKGRSGVVVHMSGRLSGTTEVLFHDNIITGGGEAASNSQVDQVPTHSLQVLLKRVAPEGAALVRVVHNAHPVMVSNMLSNGVTGFRINDCRLSPECFCGNRIGNCSAWGIVVGGDSTVTVDGNDVQGCGAGIYARTTHVREESGGGDGEDAIGPCVSICRCNLQWNSYYGFVIDRSAVKVNECNVAESSTGMAFVGDCTGSVVTQNVLSRNSVTGFSICNHGSVVIDDNLVSGFNESMYGIFIQDNSNVVIRGVKVSRMATAITMSGGSRLVLENSSIKDVSVHHIVIEESSQATLSRNTLKGSGGASVVVTGRSNCHLVGNSLLISQKEGVLVEEGSRATIEKNNLGSMREVIYVKKQSTAHVRGNDVAISRYGVVVAGPGSECTVVGNNFRGLTGPGVYAFEMGTATISSNHMRDCSATCIQAGTGAEALIEGCTFTDCRSGVVNADGAETHCRVVKCHMNRVGHGIQYTGAAKGVVEENSINSCRDFGVSCESHTPVVVRKNTISDSAVGLNLCAEGTLSRLIISGCKTGVLAKFGASDKVNDIQVLNCSIGITFTRGTMVSLDTVKVNACQKYGIVVAGPSPNATVVQATVEKCGVAGVAILENGACSLEQCVINRNGKGVLLRQPDNVSFKECFIAQQHQGVVAIPGEGERIRETSFSRSVREGSALFLSCTIGGDECKEGVVAGDCDTTLYFEKCRIGAGIAEKGVGVVVKSGAVVRMNRCDITKCSRAGFLASTAARLLAERVTVEKCAIGVLFASPADEETMAIQELDSEAQALVEECPTETHTSGGSNKIIDVELGGSILRWATFRDLTISRCENAGVWYMSQSVGEITKSTVQECTTGIVAEHGSRTILQAVQVSGSRGRGVLLPARLSKEAEVTFITIQNSESHGVEITADEAGDESDDVALVKVKNCEIFDNKGSGIVLQSSVTLESCCISGNECSGILCSGNDYQGNLRPHISLCQLENNKEANVVAAGGCIPELHSCVLEGAGVGVRVESAVSMVKCILRYMGVAAMFTHPESSPSDSGFIDSHLSRCVLKDNGIGLSCHWNAPASDESRILVENCMFDNSTKASVEVGQGPLVHIVATTFETSRKAICVEEYGRVDAEGCVFIGNLQGVIITSPQYVEVHRSRFLRDGNCGITVGGDRGEVQIRDNCFKDSSKKSVHISTENVLTCVQNNIFEQATSGIVMEESPRVYVYNNIFRKCGTAVTMRSPGCCGVVAGNILEENTCGCLCETEAKTKVWRNEFSGNKKCGIMVTTGAHPVVVENIFKQQDSSNSRAVSVCDGGIGHFASNRFIKNVCGVFLESTGSVVIVNKNTFDGNDVGVQIGKETTAHVVTCLFLNSGTADVCASQQIARGQCILAYNCFCSEAGTAVTLGEQAAVIIYRSLFIGSKGRGVALEGVSQSMVCESYFSGLSLGLFAGERAGGRIVNCIFLRCLRAVEACQHAKTAFHDCFFFARSSAQPGMVTLNKHAEPVFSHCEVIGTDKSSSPLLCSVGNGVVEECLFSSGNTSVSLGSECGTKLSGNKFLRGIYGVVLLAECAPTMDGNTFDSHDKAAVKIMSHAGGVMRENAFVQPIENGGILAGANNVVIENSKHIEATSIGEKSGKRVGNHAAVEERFLSTLAKWLRAAPAWTRNDLRGMPSAATLPPVIRESLNTVEDDEKEGDQAEGGEQGGVQPQMSRANRGTDEKTPGGEGAQADVKQKRAPVVGRGAGRRRKIPPYEFTPDNDISRTPEDIVNELQSWLEGSNITLIVEEENRPTTGSAASQTYNSNMLLGVDEGISQMKKLQSDKKESHQLTSDREEDQGTWMSNSHVTSVVGSSERVRDPLDKHQDTASGWGPGPDPSADLGASKSEDETMLQIPLEEHLEAVTEDPQLSARHVEKGLERAPRRPSPPLYSTNVEVQQRGPPRRGPPETFVRTMGLSTVARRNREADLRRRSSVAMQSKKRRRTRRKSLAAINVGRSPVPGGKGKEEGTTPAGSERPRYPTPSGGFMGIEGDSCSAPSFDPSHLSHYNGDAEELSGTTLGNDIYLTEFGVESASTRRGMPEFNGSCESQGERITSGSRPDRDLLKNVTLNFSLLGQLSFSRNSNRNPSPLPCGEFLGADDHRFDGKPNKNVARSAPVDLAKNDSKGALGTGSYQKGPKEHVGLRAMMMDQSGDMKKQLDSTRPRAVRESETKRQLLPADSAGEAMGARTAPSGRTGREGAPRCSVDQFVVHSGAAQQTKRISKKGRAEKKFVKKKVYPVSGTARRGRKDNNYSAEETQTFNKISRREGGKENENMLSEKTAEISATVGDEGAPKGGSTTIAEGPPTRASTSRPALGEKQLHANASGQPSKVSLLGITKRPTEPGVEIPHDGLSGWTSTAASESHTCGLSVGSREGPRTGASGRAVGNTTCAGAADGSLLLNRMGHAMSSRAVTREGEGKGGLSPSSDRAKDHLVKKSRTIPFSGEKGSFASPNERSQDCARGNKNVTVPQLSIGVLRDKERSTPSRREADAPSATYPKANREQVTHDAAEPLKLKQAGKLRNQTCGEGKGDPLYPPGDILSRSGESQGWESGATFWKPVGQLSENGRAMLGALQNEVFAGEANVFDPPWGDVTGPKETEVFSLATPTTARTETQAGEPCGSSSEAGELEASVEDVIALLRWLADMRQRKLMTREGFSRAVDCMKETSAVPFFFCENSAAGGPTVMVRLPKTADQVVVVPLLKPNQKIEIEVVRNTHILPPCMVKPSTVASPKQEEKVNVVRINTCVALPSLVKKIEETPRGSSPPHPVSANMSSLSTGYPRQSPPNSPGASVGHFATLESSHSCLGWRPNVESEEKGVKSARTAYTASKQQVTASSGFGRRRFAAAIPKDANRTLVPFNPADPKGTSPFINAGKVATFITAGTPNVIL